MTTTEDPGVIDMSGIVSSILRSYQDAVQGYQRMVTGDPAALQATAAKLEDVVRALGSVSGDVSQRANALAATWQGGAYDAFAAAARDDTAMIGAVAQAMSEEAERLNQAASLLRAVKSQMDSIVAQFQRYSQILIDESRAAATSAALAFVDTAQRLGNSTVGAAQNLAEQLGQVLLQLFGGGEAPEGEGEKKGAEEAKKGFGATDINRNKAAKGLLAKQPWFRNWYKKTYGREPDENHLRMGPLSWFDDEQILDGSRRPKSAPWSKFTNPGWYKLTGNGFVKTGTPARADTPFAVYGEPPEDASTASKLWHDTNINLYNTGDKTLVDHSWDASTDSGPKDLDGWGTFQDKADVDAGFRAQGSAGLSVHGGQVQASFDGKATLLDANGSAQYTAGPAEVKASGEALVGATTSGHFTTAISPNVIGAEAHLNAFAGAQVSGKVNADVAGIGVGANGSLQAGIGAQLDGQAMYQNGHILVNFKAGAALGVGGTVGANIDIDVPKIEHEVEEYGGTVVNAMNNAATSVGNTAYQAANAVGDMVHNAGLW